ncbi:hypothetical protein [Lachnoanaerobaculum saburreum]|jgi:hypothetical protein|uniref:Uncharacterized protein n=1 Tax=Lachnoanaerobaculum saburreum DSM 3986 TaxID=887325 RepID=E6LMC1_9FIRM|nr:hypothetical protein [Lachnoanaerobaculum saburreum]EFU77016.1 hypothetical protein HMPREF0381_1106 [Lachnoanaerobaculum saburreum DSM 3986]
MFGGEGMIDTVVTGPGKVYIQTMSLSRLGEMPTPFIKVRKK